jgi:nitroreductase
MIVKKKERIDYVKQALVCRRSVRNFTGQKIDERILEDLIEVGKYAPSGSNWQNQRFLVVTDPDEIERIGQIRFVWPYKGANHKKIKLSHPGGILGHGTALIIVFADAACNDARGNGEYYIWEPLEIQNCSASIQNILTMATSYGLGSCWVSASEKMNYTRLLSKQTWRDAFSNYDIPTSYKMQGVIVLGYPKAVDENGYAKGEKMHGATNWVSTDRRENEYYMVKKRNEEEPVAATSLSERVIVRFNSKVIGFCLRVIRFMDSRIHRIEYKHQVK